VEEVKEQGLKIMTQLIFLIVGHLGIEASCNILAMSMRKRLYSLSFPSRRILLQKFIKNQSGHNSHALWNPVAHSENCISNVWHINLLQVIISYISQNLEMHL
jgi:hypothetical protein